MPEAWFIGGDIIFFTNLDSDSDTRDLCIALREMRLGIVSFPNASYVPIWKEWFRYLLPDLILRANEPENFNDYWRDILTEAIDVCFEIYPNGITEEYLGFRDDIIYTLGNCALPDKLARQITPDAEKHTRIFLDIWDERHMLMYYEFFSLSAVNQVIIFYLKYLRFDELELWAISLFQIASPQWYIQLIFFLAEWRQSMFTETISTENVQLFERIITQLFTHERFLAWKSLLLDELKNEPFNIENRFYLNTLLEKDLDVYERVLFPDS